MSIKPIDKSLLPYLLKKNFGEALFSSLDKMDNLSVIGAAGSSISILVAEMLITQKKNILFLADDKEESLYISTELENLVGEESILYFPQSYQQPYQTEKTQNANLVLRTEVISSIIHKNSPKIIVAPFLSLAEKVLRKNDFNQISHILKTGEKVDFDFIQELLDQFNFSRADFVSQPGEFSVRGGIIDIFSYSNERPYRISFFGNEIEFIKEFDIDSQLTTKKVDQISLIPNMNLSLSESRISFFDLLDKDTIIFTKKAKNGLSQIESFFNKAEENFQKLSTEIKHQKPQELFLSSDDFRNHLEQLKWIDFTQDPLTKNTVEIPLSPQPVFNKNFQLLLEDLEEKREKGYKIWISFSSQKQKNRLEEILFSLQRQSEHNMVQEKESPLFDAFLSELHEGFISHQDKFVVYTDHQIFDRYQRYKPKNAFAKSEQLTLKDLLSLKIGDYITHIDHGIGKFLGLVKTNNNGIVQEAFKLSYKNGDLLYVSIHSLHKISKYNSPEGKEITLSKLGSPAWKNLKNKTKNKVKQIAFDLIKLYAERKSAKGFAFSPDTYLQDELEASFLYEDTPDQEKATADVKKDMEADTIMDRLICGDVGFGKTEVAIRAAFKAVTDGKQVAVLVPTTILAFQHFRSFVERLKDFPVNVSYLNRFRTAKQKKETLEGLENGKIDIVIGTHQLVSDKVKFKDLGLLIIDEEHKFGVNVKDKLKTFKNTIDTLTLTATPIPRTLQFSIMAARDLSVIKTPPPNRQPVETQVIGFDEEIIRDAISYEMQRDGQVYFINNRIENLQEIAGLIQRLVPDARVITGHGQLDGKQLEQRIVDFMEGKYDVLVSTTIVESGVDVPNANTIFINDAQKFGMADLHQMRGRVGRSNRKAFAYLITPPYDMMTGDARKRLEAIEQFSDLGSGFQIAMKDLEIRGAGDLLGAEQSGSINEMGFEAYQKIMQEALEELQNDSDFEHLFENEEERNKLLKTKKEVSIDTDWELMFPDEYIQSTEERLVLYQKLADIQDKKELEKFEEELIDRFGKLPEKATQLLKSVELKWLAGDIGFEKITLKNGVFLGYFPSNPQDKFYQGAKFKAILNHLAQNPKLAQLKEKNNQLMMRKDHISNADETAKILEEISQNLPKNEL